ncbi:MAG: Secretion system C-terminal sorting domain [Flavipsychrobacter sp.]|nr:Secretion system C-terminal sorting domain [Flavipsychrobacter sp.]
MRLRLTLALLLLAYTLQAQTDWWCVQPAAKNYFINGEYYLRGISVDSVRTVGSNTVLYPFKSPRGYYQSSQKLKPSGSWLGETITIAPDGNHYFDNFWGDTVTIKTLANLNDSWELYNDATTQHYTAMVTAATTATVLGAQDSVKEITITAWNDAGVNSADPLHNTKIILSKNHGFVRVTDLFMFPLHEPNNVFQRGFDYWLDRDLPAPTVPTAHQLYFDLVDFYNPKNSEVYNFNVGDIFEYEADGVENVTNSEIEKIILDEIVEKTVGAASVQYKIARWTYTKDFKKSPPLQSTAASYVTLSYNNALLIDTSFMPEEWGQKDILRYNPADTSFCETGMAYHRSSTNMQPDSSIVTMHPCGYGYRYKNKMGLTWYQRCWNPAFGGTYFTQLLYTSKNGNPCGDFQALDIAQTTVNNGISIYPNPVSDQLFVNLPLAGDATVTLHNAIGHEAKHILADGSPVSIDVSELPAGLYHISISQNGERMTDKILIEH